MRRWLVCGAMLYAIGTIVELVLQSPFLSALFYVPGAISVPVNAVIGVAWLGLKALPPPI
jgi:hypothetical protein